MTSPIELRITERAQSHIEDILQYTLKTWGIGQRDEYERILYAAFDRIQTFPDIGHSAYGKPSNIREYHLRHHIIYYRREPERVVILRLVSPRPGQR